MIFDSIEVEGLGCFAEPAKVVFSSSAVNVVHAPNGMGKSTLFRALSLALFEAHGGKSVDLQALRPWNSRLTPQVGVQFEHSGIAYRVRKRFLDSPSAVVERLQGNKWFGMAHSDSADQFVRELLLAEERPRFNKPESLGLAQILCAPQCQLRLPKLSASVVDQVRASVGAQIGMLDSAIEERIQTEFQKFFTPTGRLKTGRDAAPQIALRTKRDGLLEMKLKAEKLLEDFNGISISVKDILAEIQGLEARKQELIPQQEVLNQLAQEYAQLNIERNQRVADKKAAEDRQKIIRERIENIQRYRTEISRIAAECVEAGDQINSKTADLKQLGLVWSNSEQALVIAGKSEVQANDHLRTVQLAEEYVRLMDEQTQLAERLRRVDKATECANAAAQKKLGISAPSEAEISQLRATIGHIAELEQKLEFARQSVSFVPQSDLQLTVLTGSRPGTFFVKSGEEVRLSGAPNLCFEIEAVGRFTASGPIADYEQIHAALAPERTKLADCAQRFGTADPDSLQSLRKQFDQLASDEQKALEAISGLLCGETIEALQHRHAQILTRLGQIRLLQPEWESKTPDVALLTREAEEHLNHARTARAIAEVTERNARAAVNGGELELTRLQANLSSRLDARIRAQRMLDELVVDGISDAERQQALDSAVLAFDACRLTVSDLDGKIAKFERNPALALQELRTELSALIHRLQQAEVRHASAQSKMDSICVQSPYSLLAEAGEELESVEEELKREELRTAALALLSKTFAESRTEMMGAVAAPIESTATKYLERICGKPLAEIKLTPDFSAETAAPASLATCQEKEVSLDRLSGGEQEQIMLCTRLALAAEFAQQERQMLVLDDVLTHTDCFRLDRICQLLDDLAGHLQIVILTCHPERFHTLKNANRIDLEKIVARQQSMAA